MEENTTTGIGTMWQKIWAKRKVFFWTWGITFVLSTALIFSVPRYWQSRVTLAPETGGNSLGSLGSLASSFGFNVGDAGGEDAIRSALYPDVVKSQPFLVGLFGVQIQTSDALYSGDYYTYLDSYIRRPWWKILKYKIVKLTYLVRKPKKGGRPGSDPNIADPFWLNKKQTNAVTLMRTNIVCSVDIKTDVITITVKDQDKLVAALIADTVRAHLQEHVTAYRTQKARQDLAYYDQMKKISYAEYKEAANRYIQYVDSHNDMQLERYKAEAQLLADDRDTKRTAYESFLKQEMAAEAKLQERTPAFAVLSAASVSELPAGPKRMLFVAAMLILVSLGLGFWYTREEWKMLLA